MTDAVHVSGDAEEEGAAKDTLSVQHGFVSLNLGQDRPIKLTLVVKLEF